MPATAQQSQADSNAQMRKYTSSKRYRDSLLAVSQIKLDSIKQERKRIFDATKNERRKDLDSSISSRKAILDSIKTIQKARTDILLQIREYRSGKHYKDSLLKFRQGKINSIRAERTEYFDSVKTERRRILDSTISYRKVILDSIKANQKLRTDSLNVIKKYKESRRYADSVKVVRQSRLDSIRTVRKSFSDSIIKERKERLEILKTERKVRMESLTNVRKAFSDSMKTIRDLRADSLAKKKELRDKELLVLQKKREDRYKLKIDLKMKKKEDAWSNEKMLKKKWGIIRQGFQNTYTHYNYYFNAKRKMEEAQRNMQRRKVDDFSKQIDLFSFDPTIDSTVFASDMDSIIRKASVGIQIHDPRTKWADDLYLLMGEAYYYKGDFERASSVFKYVIGMENAIKKKKKKNNKNEDKGFVKKEKSKLYRLLHHKPAHNDAILWLTRTDADSKKNAEAEAILDLMDATVKLSEKMKAKIALERAFLFLKNGDQRAASKELNIVTEGKAASKYQRQRASFLNGQIKYNLGDFENAQNSFKRNIALHPPIEMDFYARKMQADAAAQGGSDPTKSIAALKKMLKDGKYAPYYEQVYFILGKLSLNNENTKEAVAYFQKSLTQPKTTKKQKAITFATLGNIQYKLGEYNLAKRSYDSASYFAKNTNDNKELELALRRGKSLDKIEVPFYMLQTQDSILRLSAMSEKEQKSVIKKYLKYLEKQKEDSVANAQNPASSSALEVRDLNTSPGNWYFSNTVAVQQGYNDFKRKWGSRPLADNWRRAASSSFGGTIATTDDAVQETEKTEKLIPEAELFAAIPKTEEQKNAIKSRLKKAYINLADAYIKDLDEYKEGLNTLDTLDKRFVGHEYADNAMYLRYTAALRQNNLEAAELIRSQLLNDFPASEFAKLLSKSGEDNKIDTASENVASYYEKTYELANDHQYKEVLKRSQTAQRIYGDINYSRRFRILEALSFASLRDYNKADTLLSAYTKEYPSDSLKPWVDAILKYVNEQKISDTLKDDSSVNNTSIKTTDTSIKKTTLSDNYEYQPKEKHFCVFAFGLPDTKVAAFRSGISDYAKIKHSEDDINVEMIMLTDKQTLVVCREFATAAKAKIFLQKSKNEKALFRDFENGDYKSFLISEQNLHLLNVKKIFDDYMKFYNKFYK